jgi:hypothetical protein
MTIRIKDGSGLSGVTLVKCPAIESSRYLCDRRAEYSIGGTIYCATHARRLMEETH